jgi:hypothetical protein
MHRQDVRVLEPSGEYDEEIGLDITGATYGSTAG